MLHRKYWQAIHTDGKGSLPSDIKFLTGATKAVIKSAFTSNAPNSRARWSVVWERTARALAWEFAECAGKAPRPQRGKAADPQR